ncbi:MAG: acetate--CoA ligase family protein [Patescibacteria group bacterium]
MQLSSLFNPHSILIIGVSHDQQKVGYLVARNMLKQGFSGPLSFINPKGGEILGKKVYRSLSEVPQPVTSYQEGESPSNQSEPAELAVLAVPAHIALSMLDELHERGVRNVVLFAAGFKEIGTEGDENERLLREKTELYGMQLLGPNCIGFVNTINGINATFLKSIAPTGNVGFVSQSGALGSVMVDDFVGRSNVGFSYFVSLGNKSVVDESDVIAFLSEDPHTAVIALYLEDVKDGPRFKQVLREATRRKPVVILKSGVSEEGSQAALSHTGGMAGDDAVYSSVFKQCGAIRAKDYTEFTTLLRLFSFGRVPTSPRVLVLSNAGGVGVLLTDQLIEHGLHLVTISEENKQELTKVFGDSKKISIRNPIDILGDASAFDYDKAITSTLDEKDVGSIVVLLTPQANTEIMQTARVITRAQHNFERPIYPVFMGKDSVHEAHDLFEQSGIASFRHHDYLTKAIQKAVWYKQYIGSQAGEGTGNNFATSGEDVASELSAETQSDIQQIIAGGTGRRFLDLRESLDVLSLAGVPVVSMEHVSQEEDLIPAADRLGWPVTLKVASRAITHKTEVKGVIPGIGTADMLSEHFHRLTGNPDIAATGVYLQQQVRGFEVFLGAKRDARFGVVVLVGTGGIYTELYHDVAHRVYPFTHNEFLTMLKETHAYTLLNGFRGGTVVDMGILYRVISSVGALLVAEPGIAEVDLNPLFVQESSVVAVDARVILTQ